MLSRVPLEIQKDLLIKGWMSHDARWFMAVTERFGIDAANRLNQAVCRELGRIEMKRFMKALALSPPKDMDEYLHLKKTAISIYGPDLIEYGIEIIDDLTPPLGKCKKVLGEECCYRITLRFG